MLLLAKMLGRPVSMRPHLWAAVVAMSIALPAQAQRWSAGFMGGVTGGGFTNLPDFTFRGSRATGGAFVARRFNDWFSLQLEGMPQRKSGVSAIGASSLTLTLNYIDVPLLARVEIPSLIGVTPVLVAGPVVSAKQNCSLDFQGGTFRTVSDCGAGVGVESRRFDVGVTGGAGLALHLGTMELRAEGRFTQGFGNFISLASAKSQNYGWNAVAGIAFPLAFSRAPRGTRPGEVIEVAQSPTRSEPAPAVTPVPLEPVPIEMVIAPSRETPSVIPGVPLGEARRVNVSAVDADVRSLLTTLAAEAGVSIVVSPEVRSRVTLSLRDVPADVALRAVMQAAGLSVAPASFTAPWSAVVFYQTPVNVNRASAEVIAARFDVSKDLASVIVDSRGPFPKP